MTKFAARDKPTNCLIGPPRQLLITFVPHSADSALSDPLRRGSSPLTVPKIVPGWKTTEHWITWAILLICVGVIVSSPLWWHRIAVLPCATAVGVVYVRCRKEIKIAAFWASVLNQTGALIMSEATTAAATTPGTSTASAVSSAVTSSLVQNGIKWVLANSDKIDGYVADVVGKGLRAKHPDSAPSLEADVTSAAQVITASVQGIVQAVTSVKTVVSDIK